jgi:hypothetical protein
VGVAEVGDESKRREEKKIDEVPTWDVEEAYWAENLTKSVAQW